MDKKGKVNYVIYEISIEEEEEIKGGKGLIIVVNKV